MKRFLQGCVVALATASLSTLAFADVHENPCGDDTADADNPCGDDMGGGDMGGDDMGGDDMGGDDMGGGDMGGDTGGDDMGGEEAAAGGGPMPLVQGQGKFKIVVPVLIGLAKDNAGDPISINPDIVYGVMPKLDVGIYHSPMGQTGFWDGAGGGICVSGDACPEVYGATHPNTSVLVNYELLNDGQLAVAANGGLAFGGAIGAFDPLLVSFKAGARVQYMAGKLMIQAEPNVFVGVTERDGNKELLFVPVSVGFAVNEMIMAGVQTGIRGILNPPVGGFGDFYSVPVSLGVHAKVSPNISAGAAFGLNRVAGFDGPGAADLRTLGIFAAYNN